MYRDGSLSIPKIHVSDAYLPQMRGSLKGRDSPGTQSHSDLLPEQGYHKSHFGTGVLSVGNLAARVTKGDSDVLLAPLLTRENKLHCWSWSGQNVPAEAKFLKYTGSLERGLFYA